MTNNGGRGPYWATRLRLRPGARPVRSACFTRGGDLHSAAVLAGHHCSASQSARTGRPGRARWDPCPRGGARSGTCAGRPHRALLRLGIAGTVPRAAACAVGAAPAVLVIVTALAVGIGVLIRNRPRVRTDRDEPRISAADGHILDHSDPYPCLGEPACDDPTGDLPPGAARGRPCRLLRTHAAR